MRDLLQQLIDRRDLDETGARAVLAALTDTDVSPAAAGALLAALQAKGVVAEELRGFALAMRERARRPVIAPGSPAVDIVGTGGDRSGSVNLSTGSALLAAGSGVRVVKHGNRSVSSRTGSADVLEAFGLSLPLDEHAAGALLEAARFTFLFAPYYHPAMKAIAPVRAALGVRTVFNILGPLMNPAEPAFHLIGAYSPQVARLMAQALAGMPIERAFVVHGAEGWDEPTPIGPFLLLDVRPGKVVETVRDPLDAGLARCAAAALEGADATHNAAALARTLRGEDRGALRDALTLGAGLALELMGEEANLGAGIARAAAAIDAGAAARVLDLLAAHGGAAAGARA
ncbi:MAG: Anthranilate phosphoribosyltransferase 2 [Steroidobacteraceae bacterium]|nr:Anthranilate phosphoribosyltransferase 2 [Steroidobacteraceae bacterium]